MKAVPSIILASTAMAFVPPITRHSLHHRLYGQSPTKEADEAIDSTVSSLDIDTETVFNIGEMPRSLDGTIMKKEVAKVSAMQT